MTLFITPDDDANDDDDDPNSMQDEQKKAREVSVASYVTVLEMANVTPQVKVGLLKVLIEHETDESVKAVVAPALQGDLDVTALKEKLKASTVPTTRHTRHSASSVHCAHNMARAAQCLNRALVEP